MELEYEMSTSINVAHDEAAAKFAVTNVGGHRGTAGAGMKQGSLQKASSVLKGVLIVSAAVYVTITWALQAAARFN